jgi:hypothetical protein
MSRLLAGRVTFSSRGKSNQKRLPRHPALRFAPGSFAPSPFQGPGAKGHPWPIAPLAASMPLNPFHDDSAHPPEGAGVACGCGVASVGCYSPEGQYIVPVWWAACGETTLRKQFLRTPLERAALRNHQATRSRIPVRRPSGGVAQGDEPHGCGERRKGAWTPLVRWPPERHRREGTPPQAGPDAGVAFSLVTFSWPRKRK